MDVASGVNWSTTVIGYTVIAGLVGTVVYLSSQPKKRANAAKAVTQAKQDLGKDVAAATTAMKKKADKALKSKSKPTPSRTENTAATTSSYDPASEAAAKRDEAKANQDFAQSLSKLKSGTQFTATKSEKKKQKSVKQSRAQEADTPAADPSAPSSAAGDADDDDSSVASPIAAPADKSGVSDMLEKSTPGPSVLRLTSTDSVSKSTQKKEKTPAAVESKKQRQNRQKSELKKLEREQEEVERKKLEEAQRRRARIAEGRPAKDGSSSAANSKQNAWNAKANGETPLMPVQPLDTFEQKPVQTPAALSASKPAATGTKERSDSWMSSLPSEEEQFAQVIEDSSAWNEVSSKKAKKGRKTQESSEPATKAAPVLPLAPTQNSAPVTKGPVNGTKSKPALSSHSSFAALAPEETADDEEDEEWEV